MADIVTRYILDVVDRGSRKLLRSDREIRRSIAQTSREMSRQAREASQSASRMASGASRNTAAQRTVGRAAAAAAGDTRRLATAQRTVGVSATRAAAAADRAAAGYRRLGREASVAARAQRTAAAAGRHAGAAGGVAAGAASRVGGALAAGGAGIGAAAAVRAFAGFEEQMDRVQAVAGATGQQIAAMNEQAKQLGADTAFSAKQAADGMHQLSTAGFTAAQTMKIIPGTLALASASGVELAEAAELQAATLRGFGLAAGDAGRVADTLTQTVNSSAVEMSDLGEAIKYIAPVAKATGQSMESMLAAVGLMGNVGIKGSQAGTTLRTALVRLTAPTDKSERALSKLGISASDLRGPKGLLPLPRIMEMVAKGAQGVDKGTRNAALAAIFGREALSGMITLVEQGPGALRRQIDALKSSEGQAQRTADIMRSNVAGAWDEFTGSIETASITLVERFGPALRDALRGAAGGVNQAAAVLTGKTRVSGSVATTARRVGPQGLPGRGLDTREATGTEKAIARVRDAAGTVARTAVTAGRQLLDAFKPAAPFFRNVLGPVLAGIGKGLVGALKALLPVIRVFFGALGMIGRAARPLRPVFAGLGAVIGFVFAGPILKAIGLVGKLGGVFRLLGAPLRAAGSLINGVGRAVGALAGRLGRVVGRVGGAAGRIVGAISGRLRRLPAVVAVSAYSAGQAIVNRLGAVVGGVGRVGSRIANAVVRPIGRLPSRIAGLAKSVGSALAKLGRGMVRAIVDAIKAAPGLIVDAIKSLVPGGLRGVLSRIPGVGEAFTDKRRRGGVIRRMNTGGLVPIMASGGEMLVDRGRAMMIGGPSDRDGTPLMARPGSAVLTDDGQARMAAGASLAQAVASQAPHFQRGGRVRPSGIGVAVDAARGVGLSGARLLTAVAIAGPESDYNAGAVNIGPRDHSIGLWQINQLAHRGRFGSDAELKRPRTNARAMRSLSAGGKNWRPWSAYTSGAYRSFLTRARKAVTGSRGRGRATPGSDAAGTADRTVPLILGASRRRAGLLDDAFAQGRQAGREGLTRGIIRAQGNPILAAIREAQTATTREIPGRPTAAGRRRPGRGADGAGRGGFRPGGGWAGTRNLVMHAIRGYTAGASYKRAHNTGRGRSDHWTAVKNAFAADIPAVGRRGDTIFDTLRRRLRIPARKGSWNTFPNRPIRGFRSQLLWHAPDGSHKDHNHLGIRRMRHGGIIGRYRPGGAVVGPFRAQPAPIGRALTGAVAHARSFAGGSLEALDTVIGRAMEARLLALREQLTRVVRRGGPKRVVDRVRSMIDLIEGELGRRVGRIEDVVEQRSRAVEYGRGVIERNLRAQGSDPAGAAGLGALAARQGVETGLLAQNVASLQSAVRRAGAAGDRATVRELTTQLEDAQAALHESVVREIELARDQVRAAAQEIADAAAHGLSLTQAGQQGLETMQRLRGTQDTPGGMRERADFITGGLIPAIRGQFEAHQEQIRAAYATGDLAGFRSATEAAAQSANDLHAAMADASELIRDAALRAAADVVDAAQHASTIRDLGLARLELEQRLAGTFESTGGAQARSDYIRQQVIPALDAELIALTAQRMEAERHGDQTLARQIAEAIAAKQNSVLQGQLDAMEAVKENTSLLRDFGGTSAFGYRDQIHTDLDVIRARIGS